jgi:FAD/FMN-containing dehydrogenase
MSNIKSNKVLDWDDAHYSGKALKLGAGNMGFEAQSYLQDFGLVMVAGYCPSVGPAGGYVQGGGHSPLSTNFGMAVDQTLEFELVTAEGKVIRANREENKDLFWALNGGGAGTWGVLVSMTVRVYPMLPMAGAQYYIDPRTTGEEKYWELVDFFYSLIPSLTDQGAYITYAIAADHLVLFPVSLYNATIADVKKLLKPLDDYLAENKIAPMFTNFQESTTYMEHVSKLFASSQPMKDYPSGGRLMPRDVLTSPTRRAKLVSVIRKAVNSGAATSTTSFRPIDRIGNDVSLHPAWRDANALVILTHPWSNAKKSEMRTKVDLLSSLSPLLTDVAPDSASYSNEADIFMEGWHGEMYGPSWDRLLEVKERYDPECFFYSAHTPGADLWQVDGSGRMCRTGLEGRRRRGRGRRGWM